MSLHALMEKWRKEAAAYDAAYQRTASGWQPDWQSYGSALARERCADELEAALAGGGEAVAQLTTYEDTNSFSARMHDVVHDLPPGTYNLYLPPAGAVKVTDEMVERAAFAILDGFGDPREIEISFAKLDGRWDEAMRKARAALNDALNPGGSRE